MSGRAPARKSVEAPPPGSPWTVLQLVLWSAEYLAGKGIESSRLDAEYLLAGVLGLDRLQLYLQFERPLDAAELAAFKPLLLRRASREPLQYIQGRMAFRGLELAVDTRALIPRPETEELVDHVLEWLGPEGDDPGRRAGLTAVDLGTGTGAIALSLAVEAGFERIVATDASEDALGLARENGARLASIGLFDPDRLEFRHGDLFEPLGDRRYHVIVSNPPYVEAGQRDALQPEVVDWEPESALFAGADGFDVVRRIVGSASRHLEEGGLLVVEIGADQGAAALELPAPGLVNLRVARDLTGRDRFLVGERENQKPKGKPNG